MKSLDIAEKLNSTIIEKIEKALDNKPKPEKEWRTNL